jgi:hypothetical protein
MDLSKYLAGAAAVPPTAPTSPSTGYPTRGNPATGTPATTPGDYWHYQLQAELKAVLLAAGLTPDAADLTQLRAAIDALILGAFIGAGKRVLSSNGYGYQMLPGGLLFQWARVTVPSSLSTMSAAPVIWPTPFDTLALHGWANAYEPANGAGGWTPSANVTLLTTVGCQVNCELLGGNNGEKLFTEPVLVGVFAFGY